MRKTVSDVFDGIIERAREVAPELTFHRTPNGMTLTIEGSGGSSVDRATNPLGVLVPRRLLYFDLAQSVLSRTQHAMMLHLRGQVWPAVNSDLADTPSPEQVMKDLYENPAGAELADIPKATVKISNGVLNMAYVQGGEESLTLRPLVLPQSIWRR